MVTRAIGLTLLIGMVSVVVYTEQAGNNPLPGVHMWPRIPAHASADKAGKDFSPGPKPALQNRVEAYSSTSDGRGYLSNPLTRMIFGATEQPKNNPRSHTPPPGCVPMAPPEDS
jgi:hypothetical protein